MKILSHRGNGFGAPENTLEAFKLAVESDNNQGVEIDVQLTKDGFVIIHHDDKLGRIFHGDETFDQLTLKQVKQRPCLINGHIECRIPLLSDLFILMQNTQKIINIELKIADNDDFNKLVVQVVRLVDQYGMSEQIIYSSFHEKCIQFLKEVSPKANTNLLLEHGDEREKQLLNLINLPYIDGIHLSIESWRDFNEKSKQELSNRLTKLRLWTVNSPTDVQCVLKGNLDMIITDKPDFFVKE